MASATGRLRILLNHLLDADQTPPHLSPSPCLSYSPPELSNAFQFDAREMRKLSDGHHVAERDWLFGLMRQSQLFCPRERGAGRIFVAPDYNQSMEQQKEMSSKRVEYLLGRGVFQGWLTGNKGVDAELRIFAFLEVLAIFDSSLATKLVVHYFLWCVSCLW